MKKIILFSAMAILAMACSKDGNENLKPYPGEEMPQTKSTSLSPVVITGENPGGNVTCEEAGIYSLSSGKIDYNGGSFMEEWPDGFTVNTDGINVNWSYLDPLGQLCISSMAVIVKGGPSAHVYYYPEGGSDDYGLTSPINPATDIPYGLSNLTFCYDLAPCEDDDDNDCFDDETAWAEGPRYSPKGNWATFTPYVAGDVILYAGQHHNAGTVNLSSVVNGEVTITITLNDGFELNSGTSEGVKIQGYGNAPSGNPAPGLFTTYKGNDLSITVAAFNFYGIHLDLLMAVDCD